MITTIYGNFPMGNWKIILWDVCKFCGVAGGSIGVGVVEGEKYYQDVDTSDGIGKRFYTKYFQGKPNTHSGDVFGNNVAQGVKNTYGNNWQNEIVKEENSNYMDVKKTQLLQAQQNKVFDVNTLTYVENPEQAAEFLARHGDYSRVSLKRLNELGNSEYLTSRQKIAILAEVDKRDGYIPIVFREKP